MDYDEFIASVADAAGIDRTEGEAAARATLTALGDRLAGGEKDDLADQLPEPLGEQVRTSSSGAGERLSLDGFFERVGERAGLQDATEAERRARAVMGVLTEAISGGELEDVKSQLPSEFADLFAPKSV
jgi:uncharacterized protein (DUF2267 family)